jgi:hypothetical protein
VAIADLDGDGALDLLASSFDLSGVAVLLGAGGGQFFASQELPLSFGANAVALGDLNQDGAPDILAAIGSLDQISLLLSAPR